jgi:hypothetical protein
MASATHWVSESIASCDTETNLSATPSSSNRSTCLFDCAEDSRMSPCRSKIPSEISCSSVIIISMI